jgi:hypothetical protein
MSIANRLFVAKNNPTKIRTIPAVRIHHQFGSPAFLNLKLLIVRRIHLMIAQIHNSRINTFNIASHAAGNETNPTHNRICATATIASSHLSFDCLSCIAKITHMIPDNNDSSQNAIMIVVKAKSGLNIIIHQNTM